MFQVLVRDEAANNETVRMELEDAGVPVVDAPGLRGEFPATLKGELGEYVFLRDSSRWVVYGQVPLQVAQLFYDDPTTRPVIRAAGHADSPPPAEWANWLMPDGRRVVDPDSLNPERLRAYRRSPEISAGMALSKDPASIGGRQVISTYHIDSFDGLRQFVDTLKRHGLVPVAAG